jgi:hypothetical protein
MTKELCRIPKLLSRTVSKNSRNAGSGVWLQEVVLPLAPVSLHRTHFYSVGLGSFLTEAVNYNA